MKQMSNSPSINQAIDQVAELHISPPMSLTSIRDRTIYTETELEEHADKITLRVAKRGTEKLTAEKRNIISGENSFKLHITQELLDQCHHINIKNCNNFSISADYKSFEIPHDNKHFIQIVNCTHFSISGVTIEKSRNMLLIVDSDNFSIHNCSSYHSEGYGVIIYNGENFNITDCFFTNNLSSGILVMGDSSYAKITNCSIMHTRGFFNHDAAIHFCAVSDKILIKDIPEKIHESLPISEKEKRPHHIVVRSCSMVNNKAQGIYLEGSYNCLFSDNLISHNDKEGICFDWGSCHNFFRNNIVSQNGYRGNISEKEIEIDFISIYPNLEDHSSSMKLPGVSIDNGCLNQIRSNTISGNYGGGVKMIRSAFCNLIYDNRFSDNTLGSNKYIHSFNSIAILGMKEGNEEFKEDGPLLLDLKPSLLNRISNNYISGDPFPFYIERECSPNTFSNNTVKKKVRLPLLTFLKKAIKGFLFRFQIPS